MIKATTTLSDGTFKSVPRDFYKLYTVHINYSKNCTNYLYFYEEKNELSYFRAFRHLLKDKNIIVIINPN
ncbi:hypothetical protein TUBRATIS_19080 [Tubulinosema ratisbonensis]|uniref:Uncharacterized protein n=1 Tax=Tubulinosema ratisbonensis TaxID=291195 RepID=A0A437AKN0_9MICR|nr:hypothetical protein TUBRATIS_19080 [Tubulinosema ratisbonensis]